MTGRTGQGDRPSPETKGGRRREDLPQTPANPEGAALDLQKRSELLWETPPRPSRGAKPTMSREDIVQAAISVADQNGLAALTMYAVAERLGFTTMALYRYFPNKEALIDASVDAAMGTPPPRSGPRQGWRQEVVAWAYAKRAMLIARPWLAELPFVAAPHGPNWLSWHEALLEALADTGLSPEDLMDMLSVVHAYVSGASDTAISLARARSRGMSDELWAQAVGGTSVVRSTTRATRGCPPFSPPSRGAFRRRLRCQCALAGHARWKRASTSALSASWMESNATSTQAEAPEAFRFWEGHRFSAVTPVLWKDWATCQQPEPLAQTRNLALPLALASRASPCRGDLIYCHTLC